MPAFFIHTNAMHDQKLTEGENHRDWWKEEFERVRDELDYFTRYYSFVRRGIEDNTNDTNLILGQRGRSNWTCKLPRNKQADQLFRRGMPQTAAAIVALDIFYWMKKPIDHPYLLPPATGTVRYLSKSGTTIEYANGEKWNLCWSECDRIDGILARHQPLPSMKFSKPYWITL